MPCERSRAAGRWTLLIALGFPVFQWVSVPVHPSVRGRSTIQPVRLRRAVLQLEGDSGSGPLKTAGLLSARKPTVGANYCETICQPAVSAVCVRNCHFRLENELSDFSDDAFGAPSAARGMRLRRDGGCEGSHCDRDSDGPWNTKNADGEAVAHAELQALRSESCRLDKCELCRPMSSENSTKAHGLLVSRSPCGNASSAGHQRCPSPTSGICTARFGHSELTNASGLDPNRPAGC